MSMRAIDGHDSGAVEAALIEARDAARAADSDLLQDA